MSERLRKIAEEIEKARKRREQMDAKVKELEEKYREVKNTEIQDIVAKAALSPEELAVLIERSQLALPQTEGNRLNENGPCSEEDQEDTALTKAQGEDEDEEV